MGAAEVGGYKAALNSSSGNLSPARPAEAEGVERTHEVASEQRQARRPGQNVRQLIKPVLNFDTIALVGLPLAAERVTFGNEFVELTHDATATTAAGEAEACFARAKFCKITRGSIPAAAGPHA
jgi:hypothetical protein